MTVLHFVKCWVITATTNACTQLTENYIVMPWDQQQAERVAPENHSYSLCYLMVSHPRGVSGLGCLVVFERDAFTLTVDITERGIS
jgi:hypothetical protein